jgi:hypothetical protein
LKRAGDDPERAKYLVDSRIIVRLGTTNMEALD